jgi:hypothetical protein
MFTNIGVLTQNVEIKPLKDNSSGFCANNSFILRADGGFRTKWDVLIILVTLWICFTLPVEISFEPAYLMGRTN